MALGCFCICCSPRDGHRSSMSAERGTDDLCFFHGRLHLPAHCFHFSPPTPFPSSSWKPGASCSMETGWGPGMTLLPAPLWTLSLSFSLSWFWYCSRPRERTLSWERKLEHRSCFSSLIWGQGNVSQVGSSQPGPWNPGLPWVKLGLLKIRNYCELNL